MNGKQLRNSILQWAISGRLVPQDPTDEPASALLKRINPKAVPLQEDVPFTIPDSWCWCRLGDIISLLSGRDLEPNKYNSAGKGIPYMTGASNFNGGKLIINRWTEAPVTISKLGDLLITCKGTIGAMAFNDIGAIHVARQIMAISSSSVNLKYVQAFLMLNIGSLEAQANSMIPGIARSTILKASFPLPPLAEQERIVKKVEELLPLVERYDKAQTELDRLNASLKGKLRASVLQEAISGRLVPQDPADEPASQLLKRINPKAVPPKEKDIPFDIPDNWVWCRLGEISQTRIGKTPPRNDSAYWDNGVHEWVAISDMKEYGHIKSTKEKISSASESVMGEKSPTGTLIMSFKLTVGRTSILEVPAYHNEAIISVYPIEDNNYALRNYLFYILPIVAKRGNSIDAIKGKTLNSKSIYNLLIPLPPLAEQERIVGKVEELFSVLDRLSPSTH